MACISSFKELKGNTAGPVQVKHVKEEHTFCFDSITYIFLVIDRTAVDIKLAQIVKNGSNDSNNYFRQVIHRPAVGIELAQIVIYKANC